MRHLKALDRATNLSSIKMLHILSVTRVVSGASTHTRTETLGMLSLAPPKRLPMDPFALKTCSQHTAPPRARASLGRASNRSPIKMHHMERCTGPEWRAHAHARRNAPHACFDHAKSVPRALCSHIWYSQWHLS